MTKDISRREFLKLSGAALLGLHLKPYPPDEGDAFFAPKLNYFLGRTVFSLRYYAEPTSQSEELGFYNTDAVVRVWEQAVGEPDPPNNPIWWRTDDGWLQSSYVQPVRRILNRPEKDFPPGGFLAEVTVPYTNVYILKEDRLKHTYRFYYGTTHWVLWSETDSLGRVWYRVPDDLKKDTMYYIEATDLRRIPDEELAPISPGVPGKRIEVDLTQQRLTAYEGAREVLGARIATGYLGGSTPIGEHRVESKRPSRHMAAMPGDPSQYDLPGVPWVCYISWTGVSLHGTYWHNDYGAPRSHGCINLTLETAKWLYRWTDPVVPPDDNFVEADNGTRVIVF